MVATITVMGRQREHLHCTHLCAFILDTFQEDGRAVCDTGGINLVGMELLDAGLILGSGRTE